VSRRSALTRTSPGLRFNEHMDETDGPPRTCSRKTKQNLSSRRDASSSFKNWGVFFPERVAPFFNPTPRAIAVYASQPLLPVAKQHSLSSGRYSLLGLGPVLNYPIPKPVIA
jgi:hypothetical protein